ncbi:MAG: T9SS type A sorting domain-containing protein [Bacteroidetes bacterium]|nr:T9SS type A sorting domain-containing protein [Bacteroidota bacterium]
MKRQSTVLFLILMLICMNFSSSATHIAGGEMSWTCVGQDSFLVTLTIYRDCNGVQLASANIPVICANTDSVLFNIRINKPSPIDVTPICANGCSRCQTSSCSFPYGIEQYNFIGLIVLNNAGSCCKIKLSYSMCCRNSYITTGPANNSFYIESILDRCLTPCNSSPVIATPPYMFACVSQDYIYNFGLSDQDKNIGGNSMDSISIEITSAMTSDSTDVSYSGKYSYDKPIDFWGFPVTNIPSPKGFHLDPISGNFSFRAQSIEVTVIAVKVCEWRMINDSMTKISELMRDFQLHVISCPTNSVPILFSTSIQGVHYNDTVSFTFITYDSDSADYLKLSWSNNLAGASWQTYDTTKKHPYAILKWKPSINDVSTYPHQFSVTVNDNKCPLGGYTIRGFQIYVCGNEAGDISLSNISCGNYLFDVSNPSAENTNYYWTDLTSNILLSNKKSFIGHYYSPGSHIIQLEKISKCGSTFEYDTLVVQESALFCDLPSDTVFCKRDSLHITASIFNNGSNTRFWWENGDSLQLIRKIYVNADKKLFFTVMDSSGCSHTDSMQILYDQISMAISLDVLKCPELTTKLAVNYKPDDAAAASYIWRETSSSNILSYSPSFYVIDQGTYSCEVVDDLGCKLVDSVEVINYSVPPVNAGLDDTICSADGMIKLSGTPTHLPFSWVGYYVLKIGSDYYFDAQNAYGDQINYRFFYSVIDTNGCITTDEKDLLLIQTNLPVAGQYPNLCINADSIQLKGTPYGGQWFGNGITDTNTFNPAKSGSGTHQLIYTIFEKGCYGRDTATIQVYPFDSSSLQLKTEINKTEFCHEYKLVKLIGRPKGGLWSGSIVNDSFFNASILNGEHTFKYTFVDSNSCSFSDSISLNFGKSYVEINRKDNIICSTENLIKTAQLEFAQGLKWIKSTSSDGLIVGSDSNLSVHYLHGSKDIKNKGFWIIVRTQDSICKLAKDSVFIHINTITVNFLANSLVEYAPANIQFYDWSNSHMADIIKWKWDFDNGQTDTIKRPVILFSNSGFYDISLKVSTDEHCSDSVTKPAFLNILQGIGILESNSSNVSIFPNPTDNVFTIKLVNKDERINEITIFSTEGKILKRYTDIKSSVFQIQDSKLPAGNYYLKIENVKGHSYYAKLMMK